MEYQITSRNPQPLLFVGYYCEIFNNNYAALQVERVDPEIKHQSAVSIVLHKIEKVLLWN